MTTLTQMKQLERTSPDKGASDSIFVPVVKSLADLLGSEYTDAVASARSFFLGADAASPGTDPVEFYPTEMQSRLTELLERVGDKVLYSAPPPETPGASSDTFARATKIAASPLSAYGYYRIGERGRLLLATKSEHYHAPLGHSFPGYQLLERARALGIPNATHNNTRGFITRRLEEELVRTANGLERGDAAGLAEMLSRKEDLYVPNRVLNLQTGSLAVEAALKLLLARFIRVEATMPEPVHAGKIPVFLVMGNDDGGLQANYHGTTLLTQMMRGMWPEQKAALDAAGVWKVVPIRPNCAEDLDRAFEAYEGNGFKIAGFFHEIVMMNYGGRLLTPEFLHHAYDLCRKHEVPTVADEIQSCMWAPGMFQFREYGLTPSCVAIGKGFPGGEYAASRLLFSAALDVMPQFGALVTNGQEEMAALAYLITMEWAQANTQVTTELGLLFEERMRELAAEFPDVILETQGWRHMTSLCFANAERASAFAGELNRRGLDISVHSYKADAPPGALTKLPLIADRALMEYVIDTMRDVLNDRDETTTI